MTRTLFGVGCRGEIVRTIQSGLVTRNLLSGGVDGIYGSKTARAISAFQQVNGLSESGNVDEETWTSLLGCPAPDVHERALGVTAAFEGHGYELAQGNFDGAGITWGIIGFTLKSGNIPKLIGGVQASHPELVEQAFGDETAMLLAVMSQPWNDQLAWANALTYGPGNATLVDPWRSHFWTFGSMPEVQASQRALVTSGYVLPAQATAQQYSLTSELGIALAFDIQVQNGGIKADAATLIQNAGPQADEGSLRVLIANCVADAANAAYREDVRSRKLTLATGAGTAHGTSWVLANWGLIDAAL